jgi:hypothetical protein
MRRADLRRERRFHCQIRQQARGCGQRTAVRCSRTCPRARDRRRNWSDIFSGRLKRRCNGVRLNDVPVTIAFAGRESPAVLKEIVGAIAAARDRLYVASVVLSSGPVLAALSGAIDRGLPLGASMTARKWNRSNGSGRPRMLERTSAIPGNQRREDTFIIVVTFECPIP